MHTWFYWIFARNGNRNIRHMDIDERCSPHKQLLAVRWNTWTSTYVTTSSILPRFDTMIPASVSGIRLRAVIWISKCEGKKAVSNGSFPITSDKEEMGSRLCTLCNTDIDVQYAAAREAWSQSAKKEKTHSIESSAGSNEHRYHSSARSSASFFFSAY